MSERISILAFGGSLRKGSYNKSLLRTAVEVVPSEAQIEIFDIEGIPAFNQDLETIRRRRSKSSRAKSKRRMPY